ncbi:hypothetical protein BpHYR1_052286 [Brachionus plicatilis]|uniref:Uncharacterized protein n=1 Tax=Brachionus plicatilis TaxID=10195 RepID=A0A3M7S332_BRAPC|nr:hypothetical protein BpHYR1_052286 [Brachionus plicatilis]
MTYDLSNLIETFLIGAKARYIMLIFRQSQIVSCGKIFLIVSNIGSKTEISEKFLQLKITRML